MTMALFATAAVLGLLSFFEPCTIATHTLFAARVQRGAEGSRVSCLAQLMCARVALLAVIFGGAAVIGLASLPPSLAATMLGAVGLVYVVTRRIYLPVPHLAFFHMLPLQHRLPFGLRLGLTLPACTLPLVVIVAVLSALAQRPWAGVLAGVAFGFMFTLPTIWSGLRGVNAGTRAVLARLAELSPYITAILLWGAALWIGAAGV